MKTSTNSNQYFFGEAVLVSETDLHGTIVYANDAFVTTSGYAHKELIGQPHNIIRHPDMPAAAFADMWRSLKLGLPWSGLVKNRRKNGDYYWVIARASPVYENGKVVRYLSVRYAPPQQMVAAAESLYLQLNQGKRSLQGGRVKRLWHKCPLFKAQSSQVLAVFVVAVAGLGIIDGLRLFSRLLFYSPALFASTGYFQ